MLALAMALIDQAAAAADRRAVARPRARPRRPAARRRRGSTPTASPSSSSSSRSTSRSTLAERAVFMEKGAGPLHAADRRPARAARRPALGVHRRCGEHRRAGQPKAQDAQSAADSHRSRPSSSCTAVLACRAGQGFGGIPRSTEVELDAAPGEIVGLIGHNGAGKTTLFDLYLRLLSARPRHGASSAARRIDDLRRL